MPRHDRTTAFVWLGALLIVAALVAGATLQLERQRDQAEGRAAAVVSESARVTESALNRALLRIDSMLISLPRLLALLGPGEQPATKGFAELVAQLNQQSFLTRDIRIHAADGTFLVGARPGPRRQPPQLDPDFLHLLRDGREVAMRFATPMRNNLTGEWSILIGRRIEMPGHEGAIAVAEMPLDALAELMSPPRADLPVLITLRRPDGTVLATAPHREHMIGRSFAPIDPRAATGVAGMGASDFPGQRALAATRQVSNRSIVLRASIEERGALAQWTAEVDTAVLILGGIAILLVGSAAAISHAIRRRQRADAEILDARRALQEAIDSMHDGFVVFDTRQRLVTCNRRYLQIFPHLAAVARPGASMTDLAEAAARHIMPGATRERIDAWIRWRLDEGSADREIEQHIDGRVTHVAQWRTAAGGRAWTVRDVTDRKNAEAALVAAKAEAESVGRIRGRFLLNMGRQLVEPLEAILRAAESMRDTHPAAAGVTRHAQRLRALVEEVLDLARVEAGGYRPNPENVSLRELVEQCTTPARQRAGIAAVDLEVQVDDATVCTDSHALRQIVLVLLADTIRSAATSRICVEARVAPTGMIRLRIAGRGGQTADPSRDRADESQAHGVGEGGLAGVAAYLAALDGRIEVEASATSGNAVVVMVPQSRLAAPSPIPAIESDRAPSRRHSA
jgi:signal transduction histidine kinase